MLQLSNPVVVFTYKKSEKYHSIEINCTVCAFRDKHTVATLKLMYQIQPFHMHIMGFGFGRIPWRFHLE